ncbi:hypothetical protein [Streptomyces sp. NPDC058735]|uniref:hypothetical protein n=1 Tax=unclassified Streptomyces TaxID=2593676 RepID=UPI0036A8D7C7
MSTLARWARADRGPLYAAVRGPLVRRRRAVPLAVAGVRLTAALHAVHTQPWGYRFVRDAGAVRAADPLWLALLRTPPSLFVPALDLPVWGAPARILPAFGLAELCLGRRRLLALAPAATLAGTLYARLGVRLGPAHAPPGLPAPDRWVVDTGPSAAVVVALAVFLTWRHRAYVTASAVVAALVFEVVLKGNLVGKEHLAVIGAVLVLCAAGEVRQRCSRERVGSGSGAPPIQSWTARLGPAQRRS